MQFDELPVEVRSGDSLNVDMDFGPIPILVTNPDHSLGARGDRTELEEERTDSFHADLLFPLLLFFPSILEGVNVGFASLGNRGLDDVEELACNLHREAISEYFEQGFSDVGIGVGATRRE